MKYFLLKTLYDLKSKSKILITFLILEIVLLFWIGVMYKNGNYFLFDMMYGNCNFQDFSFLIILLKLFYIFFSLYLISFLISKELLYSKTNIFSRISEKKWFLEKTVSVFFVLFLYRIFIALMSIWIHLVIENRFDFSLGLCINDIVYTLCSFLLFFCYIINKNRKFSCTYILLLGIINIAYFLEGYTLNIIILFLVSIIIWYFNLQQINLVKNCF